MNVNFPPNLRKYFFCIESLSLSLILKTEIHTIVSYFLNPFYRYLSSHKKKKIKFNSYCCKNIIIKSFLKNKIVTTYILSTRIIVIVIFSKHAHINLHPMRTKFIIDILLSKSRAIGKIVCPNTRTRYLHAPLRAQVRKDWIGSRHER